MTASDYREMIYSIVIPGHLSCEERNQRYQPLADFLKSEIPERLYRFRTCDDRKINEFEQDILGFSPAHKMNDDFDGLLYFDKKRILQGLDDLTPLAFQKYINSIRREREMPVFKTALTEKTFNQFTDFLLKTPESVLHDRLTQFKGYVTEEFDNRMSLLCHITQNAKIACLTSDIESPAIWGYYAKGTGFAVSYDFRGEYFDKYCLLPVIYDDNRLDATEYANWLFQQQTLKRVLDCANASDLYQIFQHIIPCPDEFMCGKILIHKASDWAPEKEWRLIYYAKESEPPQYPHITKSPSALYLGRHIDNKDKEILCQAAEKHCLPVYQMSICEEDSKYKLHPLRV